MTDGFGPGFFLGLFLGAIATVLLAYNSDSFVSRSTLQRCGYEVVYHQVQHGSVVSNWVEVVRKDRRAL